MANTIQLKRSSTASAVPTAGQLAEGELAINTNAADRKLYSKDAGGTVFEIGGGITDVVQDTTPQLGGDLQSNGFDIDMADNDQVTFGTSADAQMFFDATRLVIDVGTPDKLYIRGDQNSQISLHLTNTDSSSELADFGFFGSTALSIENRQNSGFVHIRGRDSGGTQTMLIEGDPDGALIGYYDGIAEWQTQDSNASGNTTGLEVKAHNQVYYDVGLNVMPIYEIDVSDTFDVDHASMLWHKDAGGAVTFTCENTTDAPNGTIWMVHNADTENITIAQGTGVTINWIEAGAAPAAGNVTLSQGGIVTVYKYTNTEYWVWGAKDGGAGGGISSVVEDATPQLGGNLESNGSDIVMADNDQLIFGTGSDVLIDWDGVDLEVRGAASNQTINLRDGHHLRLYDSTDVDWVDIHHDGSNINFTNNAGGYYFQDGNVLIRDGSQLSIWDSTNNDNINFTHDGTDLEVRGTGTGAIEIGPSGGIDLRLLDNCQIQLGNSNDFLMYWDGTRTIMDAVAASEVRVYGGPRFAVYDSADTDYIGFQVVSDIGRVVSAGTTAIRFQLGGVDEGGVQDSNANGNTSGMFVKDHQAILRDAGFNDLKDIAISADTTLNDEHAGALLIKTVSTAGIDLILPSSTTQFPEHHCTQFLNAGNSTVTINASTNTRTLYWLDGSTRTGGASTNRTIAYGGVITIYRLNSTTYYIWGSGIS